MTKVFTILNCGTASGFTSKDIIAELGQGMLAGDKGTNWIINPGPGTTEATGRTALGEGLGHLAASPVGNLPNVQTSIFALNSLSDVIGSLTGLGMSATVDLTITKLKNLGAQPKAVNFVAWSRGAITSIETANRMHADPQLNSWKVNMFLFDPVPGPYWANRLNWSRARRQISENVKTCWVVMMENACSWDSWVMTQLSKPFGGYNQAGTGPYREYFLPGQHWSAVELSKPWGPSCRIGRHLCVGFLLAHGTEVTRNALGWLISDATGVCNWYAKLKLHFLDHWASPNFRWGKIQNPYRYDSYFINKHNRAVFEKAFPYIDTRSIPFVIPKDKDRHVKVVAPEVHALIHRYYPPSQPDTKISRAFRMST